MKKNLLSLTLMMMLSGCDVGDALNDALSSNVIYAVNGTGGTINVSVTGENDRSVESKNLEASSYLLAGKSEYDISYDGNHSVRVTSGKVYLYSATTCNNEGYVLDSTDANRIHVVSLSGATITEDIIITGVDGVVHVITQDITPCSVITTAEANTLKVGHGMKIKIGDTNEQVIQHGFPKKYESLANSLKFDLVIYSTTEGTIVPMAGYDDLLSN